MENASGPSVTETQKKEVCAILSVGCDRQAAAKYVGCSWREIRAAMLADRRFASDVHRAEAGAELTHMQNVRNAARDDKHWRASVWWLERRAPERYGRREAGAVTPRQLERLVELLAEVVSEEVHELQDRRRLLERLKQITGSLDPMFCEGKVSASRPDGQALNAGTTSFDEDSNSDEDEQ